MTGKANRPAQAVDPSINSPVPAALVQAGQDMRRQAETKLSERKKKAVAVPATKSDSRRLVHELEVHQIELEMQNEELVQSRAQVEAGLRQYTDLYDFAPIGFFSLASDGAIRRVNLAGANLLGVERDKLIGRRFGVFVSGPSRTTFNAFLDKVFTSGSKETCEIALLKDESDPLWAHIEATCIKDGQGCRAAVVDITERKKAEEARQVSETRYRRLFESAKDGILILDAETGIIVDVNPFLTEMMGYSHEQFRGKAIWELGFFKDVAASKEKFVELQQREYIRYEDLPLETSDGRRVAVEFVSNVYLVDHKKVIQCNIRDITERKRLMMELNDLQQEQMRTKDRFISHVSHEFRSPLASIYQFATILLDGLAGDISPEQREYLEIMLRNVHQLRSMVDDLLEINRAAAGKLTIGLRYIAPAEMIKGVVETFRLSGTKAMRLSADIPGDLPPVLADPARVREVIINLLDNAMKFTPENGSIAVQAEIYSQDPNFICIKVSDTGCGISREEIGNIFDYLYQVEDKINSGRKGLGLGLYICKELISRHGGRIWVESEPGYGSTFFFTLPIFSLSRLLAPIMTEVNVAVGSIAIVTVEVFPVESRAQTKDDESALQAAWNAVRGCILPSKDVLLPIMPSSGQGAVFCVVLWADQHGAEALVRRVEEHLERCQSLRNSGLNPAISISMLDVPAGTARKPSEEIIKKIVDKVGEQTKMAIFERRLK